MTEGHRTDDTWNRSWVHVGLNRRGCWDVNVCLFILLNNLVDQRWKYLAKPKWNDEQGDAWLEPGVTLSGVKSSEGNKRLTCSATSCSISIRWIQSTVTWQVKPYADSFVATPPPLPPTPTGSVAVVTGRRIQTSISGLRSSMSHQSLLFLRADAPLSHFVQQSVSLLCPPSVCFQSYLCSCRSAYTRYFLS